MPPQVPDPAVSVVGTAGVTLRQLEYLVAVVDHGSFTAAAVELRVAQPSLSQQVRQLERAVGGPLLERTPQGVVPTPAGSVLLPQARRALLSVSDAVRLARREVVQPGGICIAVVPGAPAAVLAAAVARWREERPGAAVRWHEHADAARVEQKLLDSPGVVAVSVDPGVVAGRAIELGADPLVLLRPALASADVLPVVATGFERHAPAAHADAGILDAPRPEDAVALVRAGVAVAVLPASQLPADDGVVREPVAGGPPRRLVALVADGATDAAAAFGDVLADVVRRSGPRALDVA